MISAFGVSVFVFIIIVIFSFFVFSNTLITLLNAVILFFILSFALFRFYKYFLRQQQIITMTYFIEYMMLNFSVQKTIEATLIIVHPLLEKKLAHQITKQGNETGFSKLQNLQAYFNHTYYDTFVELVLLIENKGGEILKVGEVLLATITQSRTQLVKLQQVDNRFFTKYAVHWFFIMIMVVAFRYSLASLSVNLPNSITFIAGVETFLLIMLVSNVLVLENRYRRARHVH